VIVVHGEGLVLREKVAVCLDLARLVLEETLDLLVVREVLDVMVCFLLFHD